MSAKTNPSEQFELNALRELSAGLAKDPLLVQASTGNTSVKIDDVLWIKASGKWLIHAEEDDFLVPVRLERARRYVQENVAIPETQIKSLGCPGASIETAMHAVLPHKVVVHVHSVNTIAWAVRADGPRQLSARLYGIPWQWIPYTPSGTSLARKIEYALSCFPQTSVFVLGNHGLVVCGNSCLSAQRLLSDVEQRLALEPRHELHPFAIDHISRRILSGGVLYPCQAIFLPEIANSVGFSVLFEDPLMTLEDHAALASKRMTRAEEQVLVGLLNVLQRIDASAPIRYLTASEVTQVLSAASDTYRQSANINCNLKSSARHL